MALNPVLFAAVEPLQRWAVRHSEVARRLAQRDDALAELPMDTDERFLARQTVLVGYGRVGRRVVAELQRRHLPCVVAERSRERVEALRAAGVPAVLGDAAEPDVLIQAHIARARTLVITPRDAVSARQMIATARQLNPAVRVLTCAANDEEAALLRQEGADLTLVAEPQLAAALLDELTPPAAHGVGAAGLAS
jgi:CPA2 family monovalent cation:H+ antiporter-2